MLDQSVLASELAALVETLDELVAAENLSTAWDNYFQGATVAGVPVVPGTTEPARLAMQAALAGMSAPGAGPALYVASLAAYWGGISLAAVAIWPLAPPLASVTPPPGLATLLAALLPVFVANVAGSLSKVDATAAIAAVQHASAGLGGIAINTAGPPVTFPVL
jgi:hypothetical protein